MKTCARILNVVVLLAIAAAGPVWAQGPRLVDSPIPVTGDAVHIQQEWTPPNVATAPSALATAGVSPQPEPAPLAGSGWQTEQVDAPKTFHFLGNRSLVLDSAGHPHLAYGGDHLYYAWHDGTDWQIETVDPNLGTGMFATIALDASDAPRIAYYDREGEELKYAYRDGSWHTEAITAANWCDEVGASSLALDGTGRPHIVYCGPTGDLRYTWHDGSDWQTEQVAADTVDFPTLALDAAGRPHISYYDNANAYLKYAYHDGITWQFTTLGARSSRTSLVLDAQDHPHISTGPDSLYPGSVRYFYYDGSAWISQTVVSADVRGYTSLALDTAGRPHISFIDRDIWHLQYAYYDGAAWQVQSVAEASTSNANQSTSLVLDALDQPCIAYLYEFDLRYLYADGSPRGGNDPSSQRSGHPEDWQIEIVDRGGDVGQWTSLALDTAAQPHISYYDNTNSDLKYAYHDGTAWQIETVDSAGNVGYYTSLALDSADQPHISYCRLSSSPLPICQDLRYVHYDGTSWISTTVSSGSAGAYSSLALDAADRPRIAYYNASGQQLCYAAYDGSTWQTQVVTSSVGDQPEGISLALDSADQPCICYFDSLLGQLKYAHYDGESWHIETVHSNYSAGWACALALDSSNQPHISYYQYSTDRIRYAHYNGSGWQMEIVAPGYFAQGSTAVALDAFDRPHISFRGDPPNHGLMHAVRGETGWVVEAIDHAFTGEYSSLALDAGANPHISYYDYRYGDLRYAYRACGPVEAVLIDGPALLPVGSMGLYHASYTPVTATLPLFTWNNGTISPTAAYSWTTPGVYTVTVTATNPCGQAVATQTVTVICQSVEDVLVQGPTTLPSGQPGIFTATYTPLTATLPVTIAWDNGGSGPTTVYSWTAPGFYTVTVTATNPCGQAVATQTLTVTCQPVEDVLVQGPTTLLRGQAGTFTATYTPLTATLPLTLTWDNGTAGPTAAYSWTTPGAYTVTVTATNDCSAVSATLAVVVCQPVEEVNIVGPVDLRVRETGIFTATYLPLTATLPVTITWTDGSSGPTAAYSWTTPGDYTVAVTATNACGGASAAASVTVRSYRIYLPLVKNWNTGAFR